MPRQSVALLAEGVDRNTVPYEAVKMGRVALLAEGVDRNSCFAVAVVLLTLSPSSRRAWIEIFRPANQNVFVVSRPPRGGRG